MRAKTCGQVYDQHARIFSAMRRRATRRAAAADPRTGGNENLVHNWGNRAAQEVWEAHWRQVREMDCIYARRYDLAKMTDPMWTRSGKVTA